MLSDEEIFKALGLRPVATLYITEPELERYRAIAREQERVTEWEMADMLSDWGNMTEKDFSAKYGFWSGWSETVIAKCLQSRGIERPHYQTSEAMANDQPGPSLE